MHTYIFSILIASVIISQSGCANPCPDGILSKADNNTCYAIVETPMSAKDAEIACNFYPLGSNCANGHAASISSAFENTDIY
uniref:Uncharacterized protein n=1 Tax=Acrobeloides nanus TaxID=290746 RepID=A0A914CZD2_9BILA